MSRRIQLERFLQDLWASDLDSLHGVRRFGIHALRLGYATATEFRHRLFDERAAGLVYTTLLSFVPFLAVTVSVLKAFGAHHHLAPILSQALEPMGDMGQEISSHILDFVRNLKLGVLGVVGFAALFYTTYSLIDKIEQSLNAIWRVRRGRSLARKFTDYLSVVLVGPVLVALAVGLTASLESHRLVQRVLEIQPVGYLAVFGARLLPFVILCGFFTFLYKFVPNTRVRLASAAAGGVTAGLLWQLAGWAFTAFVAGSASYSAVYSGFAVLILFLIWLYAGWMIVLVGAQIAFFHQKPSAYKSHRLWQSGSHALRERAALTVLLCITRRYLDGGGPYEVDELALDVNVPPSVVEDQIEEYVRHGLLCMIEEPAGVVLQKPPELIRMRDVLDIVGRRGQVLSDPAAEAQGAVATLLRRRDRAVRQALDGVTLSSLARDRGLDEKESGSSPDVHQDARS